MRRRIIIILIIIFSLIFLASSIYFEEIKPLNEDYKVLGNESIGTVERLIYGNLSSNVTISVITGIHPREKLAINPEIKALKKFAEENDVKIIHYQVNVTKDASDYKKSRANGESLVHDYVNFDVNKTRPHAVIISHSHIPDYGDGFYLATPAMDKASVKIAKKISKHSDFNYYPRTYKETYKSTSAVLVSKPIAKAGFPTFVYEIPENITKKDATEKTYELLDLFLSHFRK